MEIKGVYLVAGMRYHKTYEEFLQAVESALKAGIKMFQLRLKDSLPDKEHIYLARRVRELTKKYDCLFIINDRPDIAVLCHADGLHLGPGDMSAHDARLIIGNDKIIGRSSHSKDQIKEALTHDISYLSVGPVFATDCKKVPDPEVGTELVKYALDKTHIPIVAIGGISLDKVSEVLNTGVRCIGVIRGIMAEKDIYESAKKYLLLNIN